MRPIAGATYGDSPSSVCGYQRNPHKTHRRVCEGDGAVRYQGPPTEQGRVPTVSRQSSLGSSQTVHPIPCRPVPLKTIKRRQGGTATDTPALRTYKGLSKVLTCAGLDLPEDIPAPLDPGSRAQSCPPGLTGQSAKNPCRASVARHNDPCCGETLSLLRRHQDLGSAHLDLHTELMPELRRVPTVLRQSRNSLRIRPLCTKLGIPAPNLRLISAQCREWGKHARWLVGSRVKVDQP